MCRLLGYVSPAVTTLSELIGPERCETFQHMSRLHADGWGTMWLDENSHIESVKIATPGQDDTRLTRAMTGSSSRGRVVHLRMATGGMPVRLENSHPFIADGIGLAHNGSIVPTGLLSDSLSRTVLAGVRGDTDSELYLAAIRQRVRDGMDLSDAVHDTVSWLRGVYPVASLNALVMSRSQFVVVHASSTTLAPYEDFASSGIENHELPLDHLEEYYQMSYLRRDDGAVVFSSTGLDRTGWTPLPAESITTVDLRTHWMDTRSVEPAAARSASIVRSASAVRSVA